MGPFFGVQLSLGVSLLLLLELAGGLLVLLADLVELLHVLEEVGTPLEGNEELGLLAVTPLVVGGLHRDRLSSNLLEGGVVVSANTSKLERHSNPINQKYAPRDMIQFK